MTGIPQKILNFLIAVLKNFIAMSGPHRNLPDRGIRP
jgi:hypothetical protein